MGYSEGVERMFRDKELAMKIISKYRVTTIATCSRRPIRMQRLSLNARQKCPSKLSKRFSSKPPRRTRKLKPARQRSSSIQLFITSWKRAASLNRSRGSELFQRRGGFQTRPYIVAQDSAPNPDMNAIVLRNFGGPEALRLEDVSTPQPSADEVFVKVNSVSVNRTLDLVVRAGNYPVKIQMPHVLGVDPAGVIAGVGSNVDKLKIGERVAVVSFIACNKCRQCLKGEEANCLASRHIGLQRWGGYAEYCRRTLVERFSHCPATFRSPKEALSRGISPWRSIFSPARLT